MPGFGRRIDGPSGRRHAVRDPVVLAASALSLGGSQSVIVEDVGSTGAKLRACRIAQKGDQLLIRVGAVEVLASVIWSRRDECGVEFETELCRDTVKILKQEGRWATVMGIA